MSRPCTVCERPDREEINRDLAAGIPSSRVASRYGIAKATCHRHASHLRRAVQTAAQERILKSGETALEQVQALHKEALTNLDMARHSGSLDAANGAVSAATRAVELAAKITGELPVGGGVTVINQLGVRVDQAQRAVEVVREAQGLEPREVAERALRVLRAWNAAHPDEVLAP